MSAMAVFESQQAEEGRGHPSKLAGQYEVPVTV
jgi:hypothetical protein